MRKILITSPYGDLGGVAAFVKNILPCMGNATIVFRRGSRHERSKVANMVAYLLIPFRFFFCLLINNPSKIIINTSLGKTLLYRDGILVFLAKLFRKDTLLIIHGFEEKALRQKRLLMLGYFKADAICVLANDFQRQIIDAGYKKKVYTQFNPVSEEILSCEIKELPPVERMLFIGRIETAKGIYISLDAYKMIKQKRPELTFDIVGTGSEYDNVKRYIDENRIKGVTMHGFKTGQEKTNLLLRTGTSSSSSYKEGLPISILEAMAVGQLIIARPIGGIVDVYEQCNFGKLVSSLEAKDFASAYEELIADPEKCEKIRWNNMKFAQEHFSPQAIVSNIERIFDEM